LPDGAVKGVATIAAAYLAVLAGLKVHVVTLDDFRSARDFERAHAMRCSSGWRNSKYFTASVFSLTYANTYWLLGWIASTCLDEALAASADQRQPRCRQYLFQPYC
jgi:hypothetical protein